MARCFTNVSDRVAILLAFNQVDRDKFQDVGMRPKDGEYIARKYGDDMPKNLAAAAK